MSLGMVMARTFSAIYIARLSGPTLVGLYAAIAAAIEIPIILWAEHIMRRIGGPFTLALSCLLMGAAFLGLAIIPRPELLLLSALVEGIGFGLFVTSTVFVVSAGAAVVAVVVLLTAQLMGLFPAAGEAIVAIDSN